MLSHHNPLRREVHSVICLWISFGGNLCLLIKTDRRVSAWVCVLCLLLEAEWWLSAGGYTLSFTSKRFAVVSREVYSVIHLRQIGGYLQGVYYVSYLRQIVDFLQVYV